MGGAGLVGANQGIRAGFPEGKKHPFTPTQVMRPGDYALEHCIEVQRGAQALGNFGQRLRFPSPALHLGFSLLPRRDIARNRRSSHDRSARIPDR